MTTLLETPPPRTEAVDEVSACRPVREIAWQILAELGQQPVRLCLLAVMINAIVLPYAGLTHDAILYGLQATNRATDGRYAGDLFFSYGSQDAFSIFAPIIAPLVRILGLHWAFLLAYLICKAVYFAGVVKLFRSFFIDPKIVTIAVLFVSVDYLFYSGFRVLGVNEFFLTARLPAFAIAVWAMERLFVDKKITALILAVLSCLCHPLVGMAAFGLVVTTMAISWFGLFWSLVLGFSTASIGLLLASVTSLGHRYLGTLDDEWVKLILSQTLFNQPACWPITDWMRFGCAACLLIFAAYHEANQRRRRFLGILVTLAISGWLFAMLAPMLPWAKPFQLQLYRLAWPMILFAVPITMNMLMSSETRYKSLVCIGFILISSYPYSEPIVSLILSVSIAVALILCRGFDTSGQSENWLIKGLAYGFLAAIVLLEGLRLALLCVLDRPTTHTPGVLTLWFHWRFILPGMFPVVLVVCLLLTRVPLLLIICLSAIALSLPAISIAQDPDQLGGYHITPTSEAKSIGDVLDYSSTDGKPLTIFWPSGTYDQHWQNVQAKAYLCWSQQLVGNMFSKEQALEGVRRCELARAFIIADEKRRDQQADHVMHQHKLQSVFPGWREQAEPTRADLLRLAADPVLDFIFIKEEFPDLLIEKRDGLCVYDCRELRARKLTP